VASLDQASIVVLARNYNPSIVSREWLQRKEVLTGPVINFVHSPPLSLVEGEQLSLLLDENRLQLVLKQPTADNLNRLAESVDRFIDALPETPYTAIGLNFRFSVRASSLDQSVILTPKKANLRQLFGSGYQVGSRITFAHDRFRVTAQIPAEGGTEEVKYISFNFHAGVTDAAEARQMIAEHRTMLTRAESILAGVAPDG